MCLARNSFVLFHACLDEFPFLSAPVAFNYTLIHNPNWYASLSRWTMDFLQSIFLFLDQRFSMGKWKYGYRAIFSLQMLSYYSILMYCLIENIKIWYSLNMSKALSYGACERLALGSNAFGVFVGPLSLWTLQSSPPFMHCILFLSFFSQKDF